ncbi:MAG: S41 family peptidase [bacterium]
MKSRKHLFFFRLISLIIAICLTFVNGCDFKQNNEKRTISNLRTFAKLYGYVRYFHPSDEASLVDWDWFVVNGVEKVKNAKSNDELQEILQELFYPIAPTIQIYKSNEKPEKIEFLKDSNLQIVTWQHYGFGNDNKNSLYSSIRTNRQSDSMNNDFYCYRVLDASKYQNKEIIFKIKVKTDFKDSKSNFIFYASNYLMKDKNANNMIFKADTIKLNGLHECEFKLPILENATHLNIGFSFSGQGKVIVDDFQMFLNNNSTQKKVKFSNSGFEEYDKDGELIDWLLRKNLFEVTANKENPLSGKYSLQISNTKGFINGQVFETIPKIGEVIEKNLGNGLRCRIPLVLLSNENGTLGKNSKYPLDTSKYLLANMKTSNKKHYSLNDENVRLSDVIITWNVFQHFFPYFEYLKVNWDEALKNALERAFSYPSPEDFKTTLEMMLEPLQDGHIYVSSEENYPIGTLPLIADWVDGKVIVRKTYDSLIIKPGDFISHIDNIPITNVIKIGEKRICGSQQSKHWLFFNYGLLGKGDIKDSVDLSLERSKKNTKIRVARITLGTFWWMKDSQKRSFTAIDSDKQETKGGLYYINIGRITTEEFKNNLGKFQNAKGMIIDLRDYPNSGTFGLLSHFTDKTINSPNWCIPLIIYPDRYKLKFNIFNNQYVQKTPYIKCKKVFIINNGTISAGETYSSIIKSNSLGILVGQYTAGANGNVNSFTLPGNISVRFSGMKVTNEDGSRFYIKGVEPDIFVNKTIKAAQEGKDDFLEKAIEVIKQ